MKRRLKRLKSQNTCTSLRPTSLNPLFSKRRRISPTSLRCTPSGLTATKVRSFAPVQPGIINNIAQRANQQVFHKVNADGLGQLACVRLKRSSIVHSREGGPE